MEKIIKIVVIDDEEMLLRSLIRLLRRGFPGAEVVLFHAGSKEGLTPLPEVIKKIRGMRPAPDVVLSDMMIGINMYGTQVADAMAPLGIRVVIMTGNIATRELEHAVMARVASGKIAGVILKPFDREALAASLFPNKGKKD